MLVSEIFKGISQHFIFVGGVRERCCSHRCQHLWLIMVETGRTEADKAKQGNLEGEFQHNKHNT
jgi:hypothetical protein